MISKQKICAGWDGVEHEAYIYKNISGKKYCKYCATKLNPKKPVFKVHVIKKVSDKQREKLEEKKELRLRDMLFYQKVWENRFTGMDGDLNIMYLVTPRCECCRKLLSREPNLMYFHHILEKRNFPQLRHEEYNIAIVCPECHSKYETNPDQVPYLKQKREELYAKLL